jgi:hypothetical protein
MKTQLFLFGCLLLLVVQHAAAQSTNHPTIDSVRVSYRAVPQGTAAVNFSNILAVPEGKIKLKSGAAAGRIYFKLQGISPPTVLYQVDYSLDSRPVYDSSGKKLFERNGNRVFISSGQPLMLKPYSIKVQTEDSLKNLSPIYSILQ